MNDLRFLVGAAMLLAGSATTALGARPAYDRTQHVMVHVSAARSGSVVHDENGQRYDVPDSLLRAPGVLINGLSPQSQQFD